MIPFNDPTNAYYDDYSISSAGFQVPSYFNAYKPISDSDTTCLMVITAAPDLGSSKWTRNGRWITIGIYRDTGRPNTSDKNYSDENIVFRILPEPKLVMASDILDIFDECKPVVKTTVRGLHNITDGSTQRVSSKKTTSFGNPELGGSTLQHNFYQLYDENGDPLPVSYLPNGFPRPSNAQNFKLLNEQFYHNHTNSPYPRVFDLYGLPLNDSTRTPYSASDNVIRDPQATTNSNNLKIKDGLTITGGVYDECGYEVVGICPDNTLIVKERVLPVPVDRFNRPLISAIRRPQTIATT